MRATVHIAIPTHDGKVHNECMGGVLDVVGLYACAVDTRKGSLLWHLRNQLTMAAIDNLEATHVLFVDSDIIWDRGALEALLSLEAPFAFGRYAAKDGSGVVQARLDPATGRYDRCGAGFILMERLALRRMASHFISSLEYTDRNGQRLVGLWNTDGIRYGRTEGEDFAFCRRWIDGLEGEIVTHPDAVVGHVGAEHYYPR